ncbi:hypothetical protein DXG01_006710, partial [Tephrocybe rancida]
MLNINEGRPASTPSIDKSGPTTGPTHTLTMHEPDHTRMPNVSGPTSTPNVNDSSLHTTTTGPTHTTLTTHSITSVTQMWSLPPRTPHMNLPIMLK